MAETWSGLYVPGQQTADPFTLFASTAPEISAQPESSTGIVTSVAGQEQRRIYWAADRRHFPFTTMPFTPQQNQYWRDWIKSLRGQGNNFYFFWFEPEVYGNPTLATPTWQDVGPYLGSGAFIDIGYKNAVVTALHNITQNTSLSGTAAAHGAGGETRISSLSPAPATNDRIGVQMTANERILCRLELAKPIRHFFNAGVTNVPRPMWDMSFYEVF